MKLYCFSGLGADKRAFKYINFGEHEVVHIDWILPLKGELLQEYSKRISKDIDTTKPFAIIGLSLGGMISIEVAKLYNPQKVILISSINKSIYYPKTFAFLAKLGLHKLMSEKAVKNPPSFFYKRFGARATIVKQSLNEILHDSDAVFYKWAITAMATWKQTEDVPCVRIHGTNDKILPLKGNVDYVFKDAGHLLIIEQAKEVSEILQRELSENC